MVQCDVDGLVEEVTVGSAVSPGSPESLLQSSTAGKTPWTLAVLFALASLACITCGKTCAKNSGALAAEHWQLGRVSRCLTYLSLMYMLMYNLSMFLMWLGLQDCKEVKSMLVPGYVRRLKDRVQ